MKIFNKKNSLIYFFIIILFLSYFIFLISNVDKKITKEDIKYINLILNTKEESIDFNIKNSSFEDKINFINLIQTKIIKGFQGDFIEKKLTREPKDFYNSVTDSCYDNLRIIQKILEYYGFKTSAVGIFEKTNKNSLLNLFIKSPLASHAILMVKSEKGNLYLGTTEKFISILDNNQLVKIQNIKADYNKKWKYELPHNIFSRDNYYIFGLYSRHGLFYPPFNFLPDLNYQDFLLNFYL